MAELATFIEARREPTGPVETYSTEVAAETVEPRHRDRGFGLDPAAFRERRPRGRQHQPDQCRSQELAPVRDPGSSASVAWDSEQPDQMWIGHRERPNEILIKNPALMGAGRTSRGGAAGGPCRGLRRHLRRPFPGRLRRHRRRAPVRTAGLSDIRRRPRRDARQRRDRRERAPRSLGGRRARPGRRSARRQGRRPDAPRPADGAVPRDAARRGRRLDGRERLREHRDRLLAADHRAEPALRRDQPHRRREPGGRRGVGARRRGSGRRA